MERYFNNNYSSKIALMRKENNKWIKKFFLKNSDRSDDSYDKNPIYTNVYLTDQTLYKRWLFKQSLDDDCFFEWDSVNGFDAFGAFIVKDKRDDGVAMVGRGFSNKYEKKEYDENNQFLLGIDYKQQQIKLKIGLYWISEDHYQSFLDWLDPQRVGWLFLGKQDFGYQVKLSDLKDGKKFYLGKEFYKVNLNSYDHEEEKEITDIYYIELELTFDVIGENGAISKYDYPFKFSFSDNTIFFDTDTDIPDKPKDIQSDRPTWFDIDFYIQINKDYIENNYKDKNIDKTTRAIKATLYEKQSSGDEEIITLFNISFSEDFLRSNVETLFLSYSSKQGEIFWGNDFIKKNIISNIFYIQGQHILDSLQIQAITLPGKNQIYFNYSNIKIEIEYDNHIFTFSDVNMLCKSRRIS